MSEDADYPVSGTSPAVPEIIPGSPGSAGENATYPIAGPEAVAAALPSEAELPAGDFLGFGLIRPFVRDQKLDWASAGGQRLLASAVGQILGTRASSEFTTGELPWRTEFGSLLYLLRHRNNDETTREIARTYVADAIARWEPRIRITQVRVVSEDVPGQGRVAVAIRVRYRVVGRNSVGNQVFRSGLEVDVPLG